MTPDELTEHKVFEILTWLARSDAQFAQLKGDLENAEILQKRVRERAFLEGHEALFPDVAVDPSNSKVMERVLEKFKTDADGHIVYNGLRVKTKTGYLKSSAIKNANVN